MIGKVCEIWLALQIPTWAKAMGYGQAMCSQLARMSALPILHFSGAQFAVKELSDATALKVRSFPVRGLPGLQTVAGCPPAKCVNQCMNLRSYRLWGEVPILG